MSEEKKPEDQEGKRRRGWRFRLDGIRAEWPISGGLTLAGTGVIAAVIVVVIYFVTHDDSSSKQVEVPNLVGMQRAAAEVELSERGLSLRATYDHASDQPAGTVLRTDPAAGTKLERGQGVSLMLASTATGTEPGSSQTTVIQPGGDPARPGQTSGPVAGGGTVTNKPNTNRQVPAVVGLDVEEAKRKLGTGNLAVGSITEVESDQPADTVLRSNPPPGTAVDAGTPVDLVVAKPSPVFLGVGRTDPDPDYPDCATGYQTVFSQQISVTAPTRVTYQWLRSDGAGAPVEYVDFSAPGTKTVTTTWRRWGEPGETLTGWEQIKILTPTVLIGEQLTFSHVCPGGPG